MPANETLVVTKLSVPIGKDNSADKRSYQKPAWAEAGSAAISRNKPKITILQWLRDTVVKMTTRVPYNKIKKVWHGGDDLPANYYLQWKIPKWGFTCKHCDQRWKYHWNPMAVEGVLQGLYPPERCKTCNTEHGRYKRARRGMEKITRDLKARPGLKCWFITLTKPNIIFQPGETVDLEADKADWIAEFRKFRRRKIWKDTFAGGYWFYEYTLHAPGDKIYDKKGNFVRQCKDFELNGHLHILATAESRIPMKELAADWNGRVDFKDRDRKTNQLIDEQSVLRYLRGYLTKSESSGICMRPFGDIHRMRSTSSTRT